MKFKQPYFYQVSPDDPNPGGGDPIPEPPEPQEAEVTWPDNWRQMYAGEDEDKINELSRYQSVNAALDGLFAAKQKIRSGEYKSMTPFPAEGSEEEQTAWRKENSVPLKAEEYEFKAESDEDKYLAESFQKYAFENNLSKDQASMMYDFYLNQENSELEAEKELDNQIKQQTEDSLRAEWGADYRRNLNVINGLFDGAPEGIKDALYNGRLEDGTPIGSSADLLKWFADIALKINPVSAVVTAVNGNYASSIDDEIKSIEDRMQKNDPSYWKDEKVQARYRELLKAKQQLT